LLFPFQVGALGARYLSRNRGRGLCGQAAVGLHAQELRLATFRTAEPPDYCVITPHVGGSSTALAKLA
jgi:hypothetical protein